VRKPPRKASPAPVVSTIFSFSISITGYSVVTYSPVPSLNLHTIVGSAP